MTTRITVVRRSLWVFAAAVFGWAIYAWTEMRALDLVVACGLFVILIPIDMVLQREEAERWERGRRSPFGPIQKWGIDSPVFRTSDDAYPIRTTEVVMPKAYTVIPGGKPRPRIPWWRRMFRRVTPWWAIAASPLLLIGALAFPMPHASADPIVGCQVDLWGFLASQRRTLCDGPIRADGSWLRQRIVWTPAHQVPLRTYCSGGVYYSSCSTSGGYFQPYTESDNETYPVTTDTVLQDEPGHLIGGVL